MATEILRPNAAGDETSITSQYPNSDYHWDKVDEAVADDNATYVFTTSTTSQRDLYNLSNPAGEGTINWITVRIRLEPSSSENIFYKFAIKTGGVIFESAEYNMGMAGYSDDSHQWATNPNTGVAWTWDDLIALQCGISLRRGTNEVQARCTQVYVEVDYTSVTAKTSSDTGAGTEASTQAATLTKAETGTGVEGLLARILALTETGAGVDAKVSGNPVATLVKADTGSGADAYVSLLILEARFSSDAGLGVEGAPVPTAILAGSETGSSVDAIIARLLASFDTGYGVEAGYIEVGGLLQELFATELGQGIDALVVKREIFAGGEGTKFFGGGDKPPHRAS